MESVIRPLIVYLVLYVLFRLAGKRTLASITAFDFVLLLIVAESVQEALIGEDQSMTNAFLVVLTLVAIDIGLSLLNARSPRLKKVMDDVPLILIEDGKVLKDRMLKSRVEETEILHAARQSLGLERMDQIKYAILETSGGISIVPKAETN
jgi:uncharacterized membrane protein YcaP (DUF421 family)